MQQSEGANQGHGKEGNAQMAIQRLVKFQKVQKALTWCEKKIDELEKDASNVGISSCSQVCGELVALAGDALECGCSRDVPGAMDAFEQANAAVERVASLLHQDGKVQLKDTKNTSGLCNPWSGCLGGLLAILEGSIAQ
jgi:hypothetical protein